MLLWWSIYHAALNGQDVCDAGANLSGLQVQQQNAHNPPTESIQLQARQQSMGNIQLNIYTIKVFVPFAFSNWNVALLGWDQVTDLDIEEHSISLPSKKFSVALLISLGYYPSALWSAVLSVL